MELSKERSYKSLQKDMYKPGVDFEDTFAPVIGLSTIRVLAALSVQLDSTSFGCGKGIFKWGSE